MSANYESPTEYLLSNLDNKILTITLNRPDALNAFRPEMIDGLIEFVSKANDDESVSVIIIEGAGKAFSADFGPQFGTNSSISRTKQHTGEF